LHDISDFEAALVEREKSQNMSSVVSGRFGRREKTLKENTHIQDHRP
jgi:hypothetical protein